MNVSIKLSDKINSYWINNNDYYAIQEQHKFMQYFFTDVFNDVCTNNRNYDLMIFDIQNTDELKIMEKNKKNNILNLLLCVENCSQWKHYKHYNEFGNYGNNNIDIYFYNHIHKCDITDTYIAIPIIYVQITYFLKFYETIKPKKYTVFNDKKFCLIATSSNGLGKIPKMKIMSILETIQKCEYIDNYKNIIGNKSCYHSQELINLFSQYKFVFVCENSVNGGYITEKIFNVFFSRAIPIYFGSNNTDTFFNKSSFIQFDTLNDVDSIDKNIKLIKLLNNSEILYNIVANKKIISDNYDNENYTDKILKFISEK